jgi:hypothetical protein
VLPSAVWASSGSQAPADGALGPGLAVLDSALQPTAAEVTGLVAEAPATTTTTTTVITPETVCAELGGPDCLAAIAECDALGPNACVQVVQCLGAGIATQSAYFPFDCWPEELGDPSTYLCRVFGCPGTPPNFCEDPDVARVGWCGPDGVLLRPDESTTTTTPTTAPPTTAGPTTSAPTSTTAPPTTAAPPTTSAPTTAPPATTAGPSPTVAPPTTAASTTTAPPVAGACDPNYDGPCVPIASTVDCADVPGTDAVVVGVDIYGLDSDNDGVACESTAPTQVASATSTRGPTPATAARLAITGRSTTALLVTGLLLLAAGLALVITATTAGTRRPGGYTFSSVDDLGLPTRYRVTGRGSTQRPGRRRSR